MMENPTGLVRPSHFTEVKTQAESKSQPRGLYELDFQRHVVSACALMLWAENLPPTRPHRQSLRGSVLEALIPDLNNALQRGAYESPAGLCSRSSHPPVAVSFFQGACLPAFLCYPSSMEPQTPIL